MLSQKTKNSRHLRLFLIALIPALSIATIFSAHSLVAQSTESLVKDDTATISSEEGIVSSSAPEHILATDSKPLITTYTVISGDTLGGIAEKFGISTNTIRWANELSPKESIRIGQKLTILPVTGIQYTVKKGDTISGIAEKFDVSQGEILDFNDIEGDKIIPGVEIIIPDGEPIIPPKPAVKPVTNKGSVNKTISAGNKYFAKPLSGSVLSQGLHDGTAVDMAAPVGTVVRASAAGVVTKVKDSNVWNGGYGYYLTIKHDNGTETLYAHLSRIDVEVGDEVDQGDAIALSGNTGRSTGPHLHFEVRGTTNPFAKDRVGTRY